MATSVSGFPVSYVLLANKHVAVIQTDCVQGEVWAEAAETVIHHSIPDGNTLIQEIKTWVSKRINQQ